VGSRLVVVGQGYVGLPLAMRAVEVGYDVTGYDIDEERIKALAAGESMVEDVKGGVLRAALATDRYRPTTDLDGTEGFDVAVISVPTPLTEGVPDLGFIRRAAAALAGHVTRGCCVVLESTTYPGTTEELVGPILEAGSGLVVGADFALGYSPERIDPGNPEWNFVNTPKVVSGVDAASLETVSAFYGSLVDHTVPVATVMEAELTKLLENTFRHVNIALVNELAVFARDLGIDIWKAIDAASTKPFGFMPFRPGPGVGGHCLPVDPSYLAWRVRRSLGYPARFIELANDINDHMPDYVVRRLIAAFNRNGLAMRDRTVLLLGFAYKRNTGDARETPARVVARLLQAHGARVQVVDHLVNDRDLPSDVERVDGTPEDIIGADAAVLLVDHDGFAYDSLRTVPIVLDCCNRLSGSNVELL
jgi:UDP-N-acetyl-D-glucosamine dehydrogenase